MSLENAARTAAVQKLYDEKRWEEAARLAEGPPNQAAELDYLRGMSLAHLQRWEEAREAFTCGHRKSPHDARFLTERAGVSYRLQDFRRAKTDLRAALRENPSDSYAREFLGTIYLLEGNLEAALKYWNAIEKPRLAEVRTEPQPHLRETLLDRAIAFSPPAVLERSSLLDTDQSLQNLGIFPQRRVELTPSGDSSYVATLHLKERNGVGDSPLVAALNVFGGLPINTVYPAYYNWRGAAINLAGLARWDSEKRRAEIQFSMPLRGRPERRIEFFVDARNENWNLTETFFGGVALTDVNLQSVAAGASVRSVVNGRWSWSTGAEVDTRHIRNVSASLPADAKRFFANGVSLEAWARVERSLLRVPERRFTLDSAAEVRFGRDMTGALGPFETIGGSLRTHWLPRARGDDYEFQMQLHGAATFGSVALDQLFQLGLERDEALRLRGHPGTLGGRKGRAPLGRRYVLINSELDKQIYDGSFISAKLGPFLDTGAIADSSGLFGSQKWLWDAGVQTKVKIFGGFTLQLSYGRDLRAGRGVFFITYRQ